MNRHYMKCWWWVHPAQVFDNVFYLSGLNLWALWSFLRSVGEVAVVVFAEVTSPKRLFRFSIRANSSIVFAFSDTTCPKRLARSRIFLFSEMANGTVF